MGKDNSNVPASTQKRLYKEAKNECTFCSEGDVTALEMHHIVPRSESGSHALNNLILVCGTCHAKITSGTISQEDVIKRKMGLMASSSSTAGKDGEGTDRSQGGVTNSANVGGDANNSVVAGQVNFGGNGGRRRMKHPDGTIGANRFMHGYIQYLVKRYHKFRDADESYGRKTDYNYGVIHSNIASKFDAKTFFVSEERFEEMVRYLHERIDATIVGKTNKSKGRRSYRSFEQYRRDQRGE